MYIPPIFDAITMVDAGVTQREVLPVQWCRSTLFTAAALEARSLKTAYQVVVVLTSTRTIKSAMTGQAPVTLELKNTLGISYLRLLL